MDLKIVVDIFWEYLNPSLGELIRQRILLPNDVAEGGRAKSNFHGDDLFNSRNQRRDIKRSGTSNLVNCHFRIPKDVNQRRDIKRAGTRNLANCHFRIPKDVNIFHHKPDSTTKELPKINSTRVLVPEPPDQKKRK